MDKGTELLRIKYRILIVEDHPLFRYGLSQLINEQSDLLVCADADNATDALQKITTEQPDLVIVDLSLKESSGMELLHDISKHYKKIPVLILSMYEKPHYADRALRMGARGYVTKQETYDSIIKAIRKILKGEMYISNTISDRLIGKMVGTSTSDSDTIIDSLASRELEIFECIGKGMSTKKISTYLGISNNTVNTYRDRIKTKLYLDNSTELLKAAIEWLNEDKDMI